MDRTYACELTNLCIVTSGNYVLMMQKNDSEFEPSLTFPGGHVEPGESITTSVCRELQEETGLKIQAPDLCGVVNFDLPNQNKELIFVYKVQVSHKLKTSYQQGTKDEGDTLWLKIDQVRHQQLNPVVLQVWQDYCEHKISEHYYPNNNVVK